MNVEMAYLTGMILGNGEIQRGTRETTITIDIPYKNLYTDDLKDVSVYVKASTVDIRSIIEPLIGHDLTVTQSKHSTKMSFTKSNDEYVMRELMRLIGNGTHHSTMRMNPELFGITADEKKALLKGIADVTGYIRKSNIAFGQEGAHRVYIEIPGNWYMVIDIANIELYEPMRIWLQKYLEDKYKGAHIVTVDSHARTLDVILEDYGMIDHYPQTVGLDIQIDVLGIIVKGGKSAIAFIEAKKTQLNLHDLGQLWAYCKLCDPAEAFLLSSAGIGSLNKILNNLSRTDLLDFGDGRKIKKMQVAKWDITSNSIDFRTLVPRI